MPELVLCKICQKRRARRLCPAVNGDICTLCCGTEREVSLTCPLSCEYLQEAHKREKPVPIAIEKLSNPDIRVTDEFLRGHEELLLFSIYSLVEGALRNAGANDGDLMDVLEAMIQTHRTLESGLVYETRPETAIGLNIHRLFTNSLADYEKERSKQEEFPQLQRSEILTILVFLHRLGQQNQNGKPRGRLFMDLLRHMTPERERVPEQTSSIII
jgi:hypothetical protein